MSALSLRMRGVLLALAFAACFPSPLAADDGNVLLSYAESSKSDFPYDAPGKRLFEHEWQKGDAFSRRGDGLGPMFNARSCVACHNQQGIGGGGSSEHNVDLLTLVGIHGKVPTSRAVLQRLHPGFRSADSVTLHAASTDRSYEPYRLKLLGTGEKQVVRQTNITRRSEPDSDVIQWGAFQLKTSQRNTPSLFGAGMIDKISDQYFADLAEAAQKRIVSLQTAATAEPIERDLVALLRQMQFAGRPARFGWKGQTATLKGFVAGACANELGLQTKGSRQAADPVRPEYRSEWVDMSMKQLDEMVAFVAELPVPKRLNPRTERQAMSMAQGALLFGQANCQSCHVQDVEQVRGLYSDLQLHDMGKSLSDPAAEESTQLPRPAGLLPHVRPEDYQDPDKVADESASAAVPYYGPSLRDLAPLWRTPPLWGVRDSAPYLHDGRAATLDEAIRLHDGEAAPSADRYRRMSDQQRRDLVAFVFSLGAP